MLTSLHQAQGPQADDTDPTGISVLGSVEPPVPRLPQPGHLHLAGATLPHEDAGKAFLMDIYGVMSLSVALHGVGVLHLAVVQVHLLLSTAG